MQLYQRCYWRVSGFCWEGGWGEGQAKHWTRIWGTEEVKSLATMTWRVCGSSSNGQRRWSVSCIAYQEALICIHPESPLPSHLAPVVELWLNNSSAMPQPSALPPRGVDWFVFPSVTLRNPEKLKCESFLLRERRGQQASQLGKKQQACFISEADGESFRATLSAEDFVLQTMGLFKKGSRGQTRIFRLLQKL